MLKDLTRNDWLSIFNIPEERTPVALVLRGTLNLKANYEVYKKYFTYILEPLPRTKSPYTGEETGSVAKN